VFPQLTLSFLVQSLALTALGGLSLSTLGWAWGSWQRARHGACLAELELAALRVELASARARAERAERRRGWDGLRAFRVLRKVIEDADGLVVSFHLEPHDRAGLPEFLPGQHVTLSLQRRGEARPLRRCYSLSDAPGRDHLRITVKREPEGQASGFLHDEVHVGDLLQVGPPAGDFALDPERETPAVLIAGGVGVTPFLSMFEAAAERQPQRRLWLVYGARDLGGLVQRERLEALADVARQVVLCYSQPGLGEEALAGAVTGHVLHSCGRIEVDWLLDQVLPAEVAEVAEFYVCGPAALMDEVCGDLERRGVPRERVHQEAFGGKPRPAAISEAGPAYRIELKRSGRSLAWSARHPDLLSLLEAEGVDTVQPGCWRGSCHSCKTALLEGEVAATGECAHEPERGTVLPCVCVPRGDLVLDA
jgi:ferredoxin-NADP reductase